MDAFDGIVSPEQFARAQEILEDRRRKYDPDSQLQNVLMDACSEGLEWRAVATRKSAHLDNPSYGLSRSEHEIAWGFAGKDPRFPATAEFDQPLVDAEKASR